MLKKVLLGTVVAAVAGFVIGAGVASERVGNDVADIGVIDVAKDDHPLLKDHKVMGDRVKDVAHVNEGHGPAGSKNVADSSHIILGELVAKGDKTNPHAPVVAKDYPLKKPEPLVAKLDNLHVG